MFLFNLDFGTVLWYAECDPMRWYSITYRENPYDPGNSPMLARQAFYALAGHAQALGLVVERPAHHESSATLYVGVTESVC